MPKYMRISIPNTKRKQTLNIDLDPSIIYYCDYKRKILWKYNYSNKRNKWHKCRIIPPTISVLGSSYKYRDYSYCYWSRCYDLSMARYKLPYEITPKEIKAIAELEYSYL